ncbi:MAG: HepT-like ribonuclease domain-containing protein [Bryobacteraceae bacterium]
MRDDAGRLQDTLGAIDKVRDYVEKGREEFEHSELYQVWVVHHLQIVGEAARGLSSALRAANADVPWLDVIALRNLLVHEYFGIDL